MITRRAVLAGVTGFAVLPAASGLAGIRAEGHFRPLLPPVRFDYGAEAFLDAHAYRASSHWHYQPIDASAADLRGIIRHLQTGFTYYTLPDTEPADRLLNLQMAYMLFTEGEDVAARLDERRRIGCAAALVATFTADYTDDPLYIGPPPGIDADDERPAPPIIAAETRAGFLLRL